MVEQAKQLTQRLRSLLEQSGPPPAEADHLVSQLKRIAISFSQVAVSAQFVPQELFLAREILELATVLSARNKDDKAFERNVTQLKQYYYDYSNVLPVSERRTPLLGLWLLFLLTENRVADFHTELELLNDHEDRYIKFAVEIDWDLMEGRYNKLWNARQTAPNPLYLPYIDKLMATIRGDVAACLEAAYDSLSSQEAAKLLFFNSASSSDFQHFVDSRGWMLDDEKGIKFHQSNSGNEDLPATKLINEMLTYAHEVERII